MLYASVLSGVQAVANYRTIEQSVLPIYFVRKYRLWLTIEQSVLPLWSHPLDTPLHKVIDKRDILLPQVNSVNSQFTLSYLNNHSYISHGHVLSLSS